MTDNIIDLNAHRLRKQRLQNEFETSFDFLGGCTSIQWQLPPGYKHMTFKLQLH